MTIDHNFDRGKREFERQLAAGVPAFEAAKAFIRSAFGEGAQIDGFKRRVRRAMRAGPCTPWVKARFSGRAMALQRLSLTNAIVAVEMAWMLEKRACANSCRPRLALMVLSEMRLMLRWLRFEGRGHEFPRKVKEVLDPVPHSFFSQMEQSQ